MVKIPPLDPYVQAVIITSVMKKDIHPTWYSNAKVTCACGNTFTVGSTSPEISVAVCSKCHPFYTGQDRFVDTEKRVDKYLSKVETAKKHKEEVNLKKETETKKEEEAKKKPKTLKEMLAESR